MPAIITYPGWGPWRTAPLSPSACDAVINAVSSVSAAHRVKVNFGHNLVVIDLARRSDFKVEQSVLDTVFSALSASGLERAIVVAVRNRSCVPSVSFVGVNPATNRREYIQTVPRFKDGDTGRFPYEGNPRGVEPSCRKGKGYRPFYAPGGISPKCSINELNREEE